MVKRREEKRENEENGEKRREWEKREEGGFVKAERCENEDSILAEEEEMNDDDDYEHVYVIRRCSIETFYRVVVPALRQITERYENREQNEETARQIEENEDTIPREDRGVAGEECSICLDASLEVIAKYGQFCHRCYGDGYAGVPRARYVRYRRQTTVVRLVWCPSAKSTPKFLSLLLFTRRGNRRTSKAGAEKAAKISVCSVTKPRWSG